MTEEAKQSLEAKQSFIDIVRQFALDLGLPKVDVEKLVATHKKNFEALTQTAQIATDSAKSVAAKQKETIESAFREAVEMARSTRLAGDPKEMLARQRRRSIARSTPRSATRGTSPNESRRRTRTPSRSSPTGSRKAWRRSGVAFPRRPNPDGSSGNRSDAAQGFIRRRVRSSRA